MRNAYSMIDFIAVLNHSSLKLAEDFLKFEPLRFCAKTRQAKIVQAIMAELHPDKRHLFFCHILEDIHEFVHQPQEFTDFICYLQADERHLALEYCEHWLGASIRDLYQLAPILLSLCRDEFVIVTKNLPYLSVQGREYAYFLSLFSPENQKWLKENLSLDLKLENLEDFIALYQLQDASAKMQFIYEHQAQFSQWLNSSAAVQELLKVLNASSLALIWSQLLVLVKPHLTTIRDWQRILRVLPQAFAHELIQDLKYDFDQYCHNPVQFGILMSEIPIPVLFDIAADFSQEHQSATYFFQMLILLDEGQRHKLFLVFLPSILASLQSSQELVFILNLISVQDRCILFNAIDSKVLEWMRQEISILQFLPEEERGKWVELLQLYRIQAFKPLVNTLLEQNYQDLAQMVANLSQRQSQKLQKIAPYYFQKIKLT